MQEIDRETARAMLDSATPVHLVEVLDEAAFRSAHIPGALNVPLDREFDDRITRLIPEKTDPVIVYCKDADCQASSTAAKRMEQLGYTRVHDYAGGKADWRDAGLPLE